MGGVREQGAARGGCGKAYRVAAEGLLGIHGAWCTHGEGRLKRQAACL